MTNSVKVSVIVPVYNGEKYLQKCLDSILAQTLDAFEIVCVDDGSTDSTPRILSAYAEKKAGFKLIRQENKGCGPARNTGFDAAAGKYVVFWDADDWFHPEALEKMYLQCEADEADLCVCDGYTYNEEAGKEIPSSVYLKTSVVPEKKPFSRKDVPDHILDFTTATIWNKMYRRSFLKENDLQFPDYVIGEDANYIVKALCLAERITTVEDRLIYYRSGQAQSLSMKWVDGNTPIEAFAEAAVYLKERNILPERSFANKAWSAMLALLRNAASVWDIFSKAVDILKNGALEEMCVAEHEEGYYYEQWKADCLHQLLNGSAEDFLCYYLRTTFEKLRQTSGLYRQTYSKLTDARKEAEGSKQKIKVLKTKKADLKRKLEKAAAVKASLKKENSELSGKLVEAEDMNDRLSGENEELRRTIKVLLNRNKRKPFR